MRKGFIYYKDPRDNTAVKPKQGQYYLTLDQSGLIEVQGALGQIITQTQFVGTGSTVPGQYLPLTGGTVNGAVLFKGNVDITNPTVISSTLNVTSTISSGGTDLSQLFAPYGGGGGGPLSTYTNGANNRIITSTSTDGINGEANLTFDGSALSVTGTINVSSTISSGGTDLSAFFANYLPLAGGVVAGATNFTSTISSGGTDLSVLFGGSSGPLATYTNGANNRIVTSTATDGINGEANLTFDGSALSVTGTINVSSTISSGGTDVSSLFRGAGDTAGWTTNISNYETLNEATENPARIVTTQTSTVSAGGLYYLNSDGSWGQTDASASGTSIGYLGIAESTSSNSPGMLTNGVIMINSTSFDGTAVTGGTLYISETAAKFTFSPPSTSNAVVRAVGHFIEDYSVGRSTYYTIHFNPSNDYFIIT